MYQDLEIIDFHIHFLTSKPMFSDMGSFHKKDVPEHRAKLTREHALAYNKG